MSKIVTTMLVRDGKSTGVERFTRQHLHNGLQIAGEFCWWDVKLVVSCGGT
jgi:hypothetical protein